MDTSFNKRKNYEINIFKNIINDKNNELHELKNTLQKLQNITYEDSNPKCRFCWENIDIINDIESILSPCACKGTQRYIHSKCFYKWNKEKCEICNFNYPLITKITNCNKIGRFIHYCIFIIIMSCIRISEYLSNINIAFLFTFIVGLINTVLLWCLYVNIEYDNIPIIGIALLINILWFSSVYIKVGGY
jgi:RING-variant domain